MNGGLTMIKEISDKPPTLEEAQDFVGGYVELVELSGGAQLLVNEEGLLRGLPYNSEASAVSHLNIVGPVILLTGAARWLPEEE